MNKLMTVLLFILTLNSYASDANLCFRFDIVDSLSGESLGKSANCQVLQILKWGEHPSLWQCQFTPNNSIVKFRIEPKTVGYDHNRKLAFVIYDFSVNRTLTKTILDNLDIKSGDTTQQGLQIFFGETPVATDNDFVVSTQDDFLKIKLSSLEYKEGRSCW